MGYYDYKYGYGGQGPPIVYQGLVTGLRIQSTDGGAVESGGALIDGANASITALADGNHQIEIYPSSGGALGLRGVLKAAGSAVTTSELLTNGNMETGNPPTGWASDFSGAIAVSADVHGGSQSGLVTRGSQDKSIYRAFTVPVGALINVSSWQKNVNATSVNVSLYSGGGAVLVQALTSVTDTVNYVNKTISNYTNIAIDTIKLLVSGTTGQQGLFDDLSVLQTTAPSTSGATIVSAKGGVTYNFAYKNASFTYNAADYYCVIKRLR